MRTRTRLAFGLMLGVLLAWGCGSPAPAGETSAGAPRTAAHPEQALIDDLVLSYRMFAKDLDMLDAQGHVSVRSQRNPNHYFMSRYLAPGAATASDIIENDLDSQAVAGPRTDQARETHLHGQIYQARPDVMAVLHAHTPEFVAYGMSSVPLWYGGSQVPVWDIRRYYEGRTGNVHTPELGRAMVASLGRSDAVLLWGHGVAVTATSLPELVTRAADLRDSARLQMGVIAMGGTWKPDMRRPPEPDVINQTWAYLKQRVTDAAGGHIPTAQPPVPTRAADPNEAAKRDLVLANRIMASEEVRVLDSFGHVSVRSPSDPNRYFVAPGVAAGVVTPDDIVARSLTDPGGQGPGLSIHQEVYKARPDVMAIVYAETPEVVMMSKSPFGLRPMRNTAAFLGRGFPVFDLGRLDQGQPMLTNPALGRGIAEALGDKKTVGVLLPGQGFVLTGRSVYDLTTRAYNVRHSALIQQQAIALRGTVAYLDDPPPPPAADAKPSGEEEGPGPTFPDGEPAGEGRDWVYWRQMYGPAQ